MGAERQHKVGIFLTTRPILSAPPILSLQQDIFSQARACSRRAPRTVPAGEALGAGQGGRCPPASRGQRRTLPGTSPSSPQLREAPLRICFTTERGSTPRTLLRRACCRLSPARIPPRGPLPAPPRPEPPLPRGAFPAKALASGWPRLGGFACFGLTLLGTARPWPESRRGRTRLFLPSRARFSFPRGRTNDGWKTTVAAPRRWRNRPGIGSPGAPDAAAGRTLLRKR